MAERTPIQKSSPNLKFYAPIRALHSDISWVLVDAFNGQGFANKSGFIYLP